MSAPTDDRTALVVGAGAIGASWSALLAHHGWQVLVTDPDPAAHDRLRSQASTFLADLGSPEALERIVTGVSVAEGGSHARVVLEAGPERLELKRELIAALDAACPPEVVIASSSSGLLPSAFQSAARHPERVLVAHPFNPPHLVPLVEIVPGRATSEAAVEHLDGLLRSWGRRPIRLHREVPGHVANRLQAALWREAYHLVATGVVSAADLDVAVAEGPGLRWALLGPLLTQHLSGGPGGLQHVLDHLGPPMVEWWHDLGTPEFTDDLVATLVAGVAEEIEGIEGGEAAARARRDRALLGLLTLKSELGLATR
ncbi:3-hydroxyacyl-CoA dehydrogenase NAD-binding domain-containing protein [Nocardioides fonticola]|uniref:3-hydroxyacyl-CoA dehydrogenase NAD-binding domain-containing protein n=1 Tax=Nocardioides fonticola TaxID=450363 RepID=A0ABP7XVU2_9ACTN